MENIDSGKRDGAFCFTDECCTSASRAIGSHWIMQVAIFLALSSLWEMLDPDVLMTCNVSVESGTPEPL